MSEEIKKPKIKWKNFWLWFKDQACRKKAFYNFFISRNAWGAFSIYSHIRRNTNEPKIEYHSFQSAQKAAEKMGQKHHKHFSVYKCLYCNGYHIGKNKFNK